MEEIDPLEETPSYEEELKRERPSWFEYQNLLKDPDPFSPPPPPPEDYPDVDEYLNTPKASEEPLRNQLAAEPFKSAWSRFMGAGSREGVAGVFPEPTNKMQEAYQRAVGYFADVGLAGLDLTEAAFGFAVGTAAEGLPFLDEESEKRLAMDLMAMPEAFAGNPVGAARTADDFLESAGKSLAPAAKKVEDTFSQDPNTTYMFGGAKAKRFPTKAYLDFRKNSSGDPDQDWEDKGFEILKGKYGQRVVFEIDPKGAKVVNPNILNSGESYDIKDVISFPELFENYPQLEYFDVRITPNNKAVGGSFDAEGRVINITSGTLLRPGELRSVLLHELQHGIQAVEGTSGGASQEWFLQYDKSTGLFSTPLKDMEGDVNELNKAYERAQRTDADRDWKDYESAYLEAAHKAFKKYLTNSGEVEARAAQLWDNLSPQERRETKPSDVYKQALGLLVKDYGDNFMPTNRLPHWRDMK